MGLVLLQPDLGTALTYAPIVMMAVLLAGIRLKHIAVLTLLFALTMPVAWTYGHGELD